MVTARAHPAAVSAGVLRRLQPAAPPPPVDDTAHAAAG